VTRIRVCRSHTSRYRLTRKSTWTSHCDNTVSCIDEQPVCTSHLRGWRRQGQQGSRPDTADCRLLYPRLRIFRVWWITTSAVTAGKRTNIGKGCGRENFAHDIIYPEERRPPGDPRALKYVWGGLLFSCSFQRHRGRTRKELKSWTGKTMTMCNSWRLLQFPGLQSCPVIRIL